MAHSGVSGNIIGSIWHFSRRLFSHAKGCLRLGSRNKYLYHRDRLREVAGIQITEQRRDRAIHYPPAVATKMNLKIDFAIETALTGSGSPAL